MDESSIQVIQEELAEEFHTLGQTHTTSIGTILEEFTVDQDLLAIEMDGYECEHL